MRVRGGKEDLPRARGLRGSLGASLISGSVSEGRDSVETRSKLETGSTSGSCGLQASDPLDSRSLALVSLLLAPRRASGGGVVWRRIEAGDRWLSKGPPPTGAAPSASRGKA